MGKSPIEKSTSELTVDYIKEHPYIKHCLKKGLINYSSLARLISKELKIAKKTSIEAILVAARRLQLKISKESSHEKEIKDILKESEIEVKNKIVVFVIEKTADQYLMEKLQKKVRDEKGILYLLESSTTYTIITQEKYAKIIPGKVIFKNENLALIDVKSSLDIETTPGTIAYLTSLFAENGVNILEFLSCWCETLFVVDIKDINKALTFLNF
ncbi:MAG: hypothetical protein ABIH82_03015 [Candidatus Woesearchaeota archaeon]